MVADLHVCGTRLDLTGWCPTCREVHPVSPRDERRYRALIRERDRYREALEKIADETCMVVRGYIDTGVPVKIAREALDG